jgi:hypothetical protein
MLDILNNPEYTDVEKVWENALEDGIMDELVFSEEIMNYKRMFTLGYLLMFTKLSSVFRSDGNYNDIDYSDMCNNAGALE